MRIRGPHAGRELLAAIGGAKFSDAWIVGVQVVLEGNFMKTSARKFGEFFAR
jgi:hypothetical protein